MTIASEISRLQTDKEAMRQAIIGKGVDVAASVSFDDYASCIAAIPSGQSIYCVDFLLVGGGGSGAMDAGGGAGGVISQQNNIILGGTSYNITIGAGGTGSCLLSSNGGDSCFDGYVAYGGGASGDRDNNCGKCGGSGGGGRMWNTTIICPGGQGTAGQGYPGGKGGSGGYQGRYLAGGGGGGAGGQGYNGKDGTSCTSMGGIGISSDISGQTTRYAGGGSGCDIEKSTISANCGGTASGCSATYCGGGGGALGGSGGNGVFILRYLTSCGYVMSGGCKYNCGSYTIHCFTNNGVLTVS